MTDGKPWHIVMDDSAKTTVRSAWLEFGTGSAKNMDNEGVGRLCSRAKSPIREPVPGHGSNQPAYFRYLDRKIDYLNANGFIPFIEVSRRDAGSAGTNTTDGPTLMFGSSSIFSRAIRQTIPS